jgi:hypothetical protein
VVNDDENELLVAAFRQLSRGAGLVARHQRKNVGEVELRLTLGPPLTRTLVRRVLSGQGRLLASEAYERAILGAGTWNLQPTVVTVRCADRDGGTALHVRGVACEGLLRQRAGEETARRIAHLITAMAARLSASGSPRWP